MCCRLYHIRCLDAELFAVLKESVGVEFSDIHNALVLTLGTFEHLILAGVAVRGKVAYVCYIHYSLDIKAGKAHIFFKHVLHDIAPEVADMRKVINGRAAGIHRYLARLIRNKFLDLM